MRVSSSNSWWSSPSNLWNQLHKGVAADRKPPRIKLRRLFPEAVDTDQASIINDYIKYIWCKTRQWKHQTSISRTNHAIDSARISYQFTESSTQYNTHIWKNENHNAVLKVCDHSAIRTWGKQRLTSTRTEISPRFGMQQIILSIVLSSDTDAISPDGLKLLRNIKIDKLTDFN